MSWESIKTVTHKCTESWREAKSDALCSDLVSCVPSFCLGLLEIGAIPIIHSYISILQRTIPL